MHLSESKFAMSMTSVYEAARCECKKLAIMTLPWELGVYFCLKEEKYLPMLL